MGANGSKRTVDISTPPDKESENAPTEKMNKIDEPEYRNGSATHSEEAKAEEGKPEEPVEPKETSPTETDKKLENGEETVVTPEENQTAEEPKKKNKKNWSLSSLSFLKKPNKDPSPVKDSSNQDSEEQKTEEVEAKEAKEVATPNDEDKKVENGDETIESEPADTTETKTDKPKGEPKKKWSFRSMSFLKKPKEASPVDDTKNKESETNGEPAKEEEKETTTVVDEEKKPEETEEEKTVSSPTADETPKSEKDEKSSAKKKKKWSFRLGFNRSKDGDSTKVQAPSTEETPVKDEKLAEEPETESEAKKPEETKPEETSAVEVKVVETPKELFSQLREEVKTVREEVKSVLEVVSESVKTEVIETFHEIKEVVKSPVTEVTKITEVTKVTEVKEVEVVPEVPVSLPPEDIVTEQRLSLHEEMNGGGGESMAEIIEENGLSVTIEKEDSGKLNGYHIEEIEGVCKIPQINEKQDLAPLSAHLDVITPANVEIEFKAESEDVTQEEQSQESADDDLPEVPTTLPPNLDDLNSDCQQEEMNGGGGESMAEIIDEKLIEDKGKLNGFSGKEKLEIDMEVSKLPTPPSDMLIVMEEVPVDH